MIRLPILNSPEYYTLHPSKVVAVGLNYREHITESPGILTRPADSAAGRSEPSEPILFAKTPNVLIGAGEDIVIPRSFLARYGLAGLRTDYEAELAVLVGKRSKNVTVAEAMECILGFSCFNDVSQREIQNMDRSGWFRGKSFDTFGPIGPALAPARGLGNPQALKIECRLNGRVVQSGNTTDMIFGVAELVSFISQNMTLEEGDIIATGTPSGVGPLVDGDVVEVEIEGIGILKNAVREA
ncbi:MAG TPA: fumarylacetoacetate hydrolase family protein [Rectinemataceae bacterium]|nr:fumarylacetoacetate hydrolase family protein [Rectinemataceae bacterium]